MRLCIATSQHHRSTIGSWFPVCPCLPLWLSLPLSLHTSSLPSWGSLLHCPFIMTLCRQCLTLLSFHQQCPFSCQWIPLLLCWLKATWAQGMAVLPYVLSAPFTSEVLSSQPICKFSRGSLVYLSKLLPWYLTCLPQSWVYSEATECRLDMVSMAATPTCSTLLVTLFVTMSHASTDLLSPLFS